MHGDSLECSMAAPFKCALTSCDKFISSSMILSHFIQTHQRDENGVEIKEVEEKEKITLAVTGDFLKLDRNVCLGILAYAIDDKNHSNALLSHDCKHIEHHLPILIMACRGNYTKMIDGDFIDPEADFITIWLLTPETIPKRRIFATLTVHDEDLKKSLSTIVQVRNAKDSQDTRSFTNTETDFLTVNSGFLKQVSTEGSFLVEISICENLI